MKPGKDHNKNSKNEFQWKRAARTSLIWVFIFSAALFMSNLFTNEGQNKSAITYKQYREFLEDRKIVNVAVVDKIITGELAPPQSITTESGISKEISQFEVILPFVDKEVMAEWEGYGVEYTFKEQSLDWTGYFLNILPWLLIIGFWIFLMRRMQGGGGGMKSIFNFGKSRAKIWTSDKPKVTFDDVAGCVEAKEELNEVIDFLKKPNRFQKLGATIPKGVLLVGRPGTGKTLLARAVAGEAGVPFYSLSGADFVEMFVGVGASRVRDLFEEGKKTAPCIIFIDELDAVGRQRGAGLGGGHDEREQTLNQLLVEMDGFEPHQNIIIMAATNRPDVLDHALLRPGRFDRQVVVDVPDAQGRLGILKVHAKKIVLNKRKVKLMDLAKGTPGLVGADLANIVNEAALLAARKRKKSVDMSDFDEAKDKVMMGVQRKSVILSEKEKELTAYHESGHALVAMKTPGADPVHKVTIIPRGQALGLTMQLPINEQHTYRKKYIEGMLNVMMGGRAAEMIIFKEMTTGAGDDIEKATNIARKMVCEWGMSGKLGPMTFGKKNEEVFLGRDFHSQHNYSDETATLIDEEVVKIIRKAESNADQILLKNLDMLHSMAKELLKHETLDASDIEKILDGKSIRRSKNGSAKPKTGKRKNPSVKKSPKKT
ncbi:MAG: ATP-dependent metallopeptidase FtsH/Yme1/Tma family protein [Candidatus Marinimicrobia bacterium]|nr:ATP-dependent metallopeptidase FtsH/Yme1/Tma family protein [Candidatus Neomarinimicrobiota bacterium]MBT3618435.1 ATP-dependent metallopeptidase FtsH/Yme1/Tma family protein [Candidatus Neomarinimicrobiota bacterium]MBT3829009.1 ATP-dependent metallopeptidase FtsH/Yme1/Tma family protein [Candidatus Neomarinimicrobiota bacterium]MBT3997948.1 ATP-dependent metallopeptidase FtsH/Yme1/Tma family protein [Candidatus Neomarinimicrobiota bacterium]MBT4280030.1 ATP-dependent metallopeptidase FtsH/